MTWRAHGSWRVHVQRYDAMVRCDIRARIQVPGRLNKRFDKVFIRRRLGVALVHDGIQPTVARGAQCDTLHGVGSIANAVNISRRESTTLTGRPVTREPSAAS